MTEEVKLAVTLKLIILGACFLNLTQGTFHVEEVAIILIVILTSLLLEYRPTKQIKGLVLIVTIITSVWMPEVGLFFPVIFFDYIDSKKRWTLIVYPVIGLAIMLVHYVTAFHLLLVYAFISVIAVYLRMGLTNYLEVKQKYTLLEHSSEEQKFVLETRNNALINEQNLNLSLGISEERNRIARDIHDNVGHLLSSALIQLGAINVLNQNETLKKPLSLVSQTIEEGMENIRQSVHDIHDDSLDLQRSVTDIIDHMSQFTVDFRYSLTSTIENQLKIDFLMVIRESLANCLKYSNGTKITLELSEQPGFYRLLIRDNGTDRQAFNPQKSGIGITSMKKRMTDQAGRLTAEQTQQGFQVLAIVPKNQGGS